MVWCIVAIFAALLQSTKNALQKYLKGFIYSPDIINWVRFSFGLPFILISLIIIGLKGYNFPEISSEFLFFCIVAALSQIIGAKFMISLFSYRSFAVGITYTRTQVIQAALFEIFLFGAYISTAALVMIMIGLIGVFIISLVDEKISIKSFLSSIISKTALIGILSGSAYAISSIMSRQAMLLLEREHLLDNAFFTLAVIMFFESLILGLWILFKNKKSFLEISKNWKLSTLVGFSGASGTMLYFIGYSLEKVAYVSGVGQIELLFSILMTHFVFKEKIKKLEIIGMVFLVLSVVLLPFFI